GAGEQFEVAEREVPLFDDTEKFLSHRAGDTGNGNSGLRVGHDASPMTIRKMDRAGHYNKRLGKFSPATCEAQGWSDQRERNPWDCHWRYQRKNRIQTGITLSYLREVDC